jgi:5-methylcytosine-specific restriction endonuclease McrA
MAAAQELAEVANQVAAGNATREDVDAVLANALGAERQIFGPRPRAKKGEGGGPRILDYLMDHVGESVAGEELRAASGFIGEWARRVRELNVEKGYDIEELGGSMYRLNDLVPDEARAADWQVLNSIRRSGGSARQRVERLLEAKVGQVVNRTQIDYVADSVREGSRRLRELREEFGWPINSNIDEPELRPSEYRLVSSDLADRGDVRQRLYPEKLRQRIFERDDYTCQICGRDREKALAAGDTRFYLEVHHKTAVAEELDALLPDELNDPANLVTLCHADHLKETAAFQERRRQERKGS